MAKTPRLPDIPEDERTPLVAQLLEVIHYQMEVIQGLKDEIAVLKGNKPKPKINPGKMDNGSEDNQDKKSSEGKRPGSTKKSKAKQLPIHRTIPIAAQNVPEGSEFKGYKEFIVQGLLIQCHNIRYLMERWETPDGSYVEGKLPPTVNGHFSPELISYILYQYYQCHVTQPLLLEQLHEFDIDISSGQISRILVEGHDGFHTEKDDILSTGLEISSPIHVDDTGARHKGKNGVCTHIGNELFAWFCSTESKSRINFLELLRGGYKDYHLSEEALDYMEAQKLPKARIKVLKKGEIKVFSGKQHWKSHLQRLGIVKKHHIQIATEGALLGSILEHGFNPNLVILSDDAGQFNILLHALCWIHAERTISKLIPFNEQQRTALETTRKNIWDFYADLKLYKENPTQKMKIELENKFDEVFKEKTCYMTLNNALKRLYNNKAELLLVLDRPEIPLHNNLSESDIRE
ncbi:MAG: transposase, partial [Gammaproteobacteria bacterium]|nr:transposase [Gammaproteobacteria bacterium]